VYKTDYPLDEQSVKRLCGIINAIYDRYLDESNIIWHIFVPDKNAFLSNTGHLVLDYAKMEYIILDSVNKRIKYIDIKPFLSADSYYRTDSHWRQETLFPVAEKIAAAMGFDLNHKPFTENRFDAFFGVYYGQSALNMPPDELIWLTNETTNSIYLTTPERPGQRFPVYDLTQLTAVDPYNLFMLGPVSIVTAVNHANEGGRRLIIFRDSFAAPLAPLLLDAFYEITMIDLRYVNPDILGRFVDFNGADVLFIYSAGLYNNSDSVRNVTR
jgi:hypothetical protein